MTAASVKLTLSGIKDARLAQLAANLERDLSRSGIPAKPVDVAPSLSEKGDPVTLGVLALTFISSGALTALIDCFKVHLSRERTLKIKLTRPDGTQLDIDAQNVDTPAIHDALDAVVSAKSE